MKVRDILNDCVFKLGYAGRVDASEGAENGAEEMNILDMLVRCVNLVYAEMCVEYKLNVVSETVNFVDNKFELCGLTNKFAYAVCLKHNGRSRRIKQYPSHIESDFSGEAELEFAAMPPTLTADSTIPDAVPSGVISDGAVSEYAYANNMLDSAVQYERKFKEGMSNIFRRGSSKYVKARRWI